MLQKRAMDVLLFTVVICVAAQVDLVGWFHTLLVVHAAHAPASLEVLADSLRGERRLLVPLSHGCGSAASPADCLRETAVPMLRRPHMWILGLPFHRHFDVTFHAGRGSPQAGTAPLQLLFRAASGAARCGPTSERV